MTLNGCHEADKAPGLSVDGRLDILNSLTHDPPCEPEPDGTTPDAHALHRGITLMRDVCHVASGSMPHVAT